MRIPRQVAASAAETLTGLAASAEADVTLARQAVQDAAKAAGLASENAGNAVVENSDRVADSVDRACRVFEAACWLVAGTVAAAILIDLFRGRPAGGAA